MTFEQGQATGIIQDIRDGSPVFGRMTGIAPAGFSSYRTIIWVDATDGSNSNDGLKCTNAVLTIDYAVGLTTPNKNDMILVLQGNYDENTGNIGVRVDKQNIHILGLGGSLCHVENSNVGATIVFSISAGNCEIAGFTISETTNTVEGIIAMSSFSYIHDNVFDGAMENAIRINSNDITVINNKIIDSTNDGIECQTNATHCIVSGNEIYNVGDNAIHCNGDGCDSNFIYDNIINCGAGTTDVCVRITSGDDNMVVGNYGGQWGTAPYIDTGSNNITSPNNWEIQVVTSSLAYDVSEIDATTPNADTKIISIDNATYPMFELSKIKIDISDWNGKYGAGKILTIEMREDVQGAGTPKAYKKKTYTQGTDVEEVLFVDDLSGGQDLDLYVYSDDETGGDFEIFYHYLLKPL